MSDTSERCFVASGAGRLDRKLQKQRKEVRQFTRLQFEAVGAVAQKQAVHGLAARATFAVYVLKQM
jgi:hypothetical protein